MLKFFKALFSDGGGIVSSIERVASEMIETDMETEQAKAVRIKALDPNGAMRRAISINIGNLFKLYVLITVLMIGGEFIIGAILAFNQVPNVAELMNVLATATGKIKDLFTPICTLYGLIVSASFGVNYANVRKEQKNDETTRRNS